MLLVSAVAERQLKTPTAPQVANTAAFNWFAGLIQVINDNTDGRSNTFLESAMWADDIKVYGVDFYEPYETLKIPYDPEYLFKSMSQLQRTVNFLSFLDDIMATLRTNKGTTSASNTVERSMMARFLVSTVAKMHMPLNSINYYSSNHPWGDNNGKSFSFTDSNSNPQTLYDFVSQRGGQSAVFSGTRPFTAGGADTTALEAEATTIAGNYLYSASQVENENFKIWATTTYQAARDQIYGQISQGSSTISATETAIQTLCENQIALAGYRLSYLIATLYGQQ